MAPTATPLPCSITVTPSISVSSTACTDPSGQITFSRLAQAEGDGALDLGEVAAGGHHLAALGGAAGCELDPGADGVAVGG